jgi:hypothetical protein
VRLVVWGPGGDPAVVQRANLVLAGAATVAMRALAGVDLSIAGVAYGDSGTTPAPAQTGPQGAFGVVPATAEFGDGAVTTSFEIGGADNAVGVIRELALRCADGSAVARVVLAEPVAKSPLVRLEGTWTIELELAP